MSAASDRDRDRAATGISGLDEILGGGFPRNHMYVVEGTPGAGKTTLAMQFLLEGLRLGEAGLYVTLSETEEELEEIAQSHGWSIQGITVCDLQMTEDSLKSEAQYTLFHPSEVELGETTRSILDVFEQVQPRRVVFDSLPEMRLLARDSLRYRRQILSLKHYFAERKCTVLMLDARSEQPGYFQLQTVAHGVLLLEHLSPHFGGHRRRLRVQKMRGINFQSGYHDFSLKTGGLVIYPRLVAADHPQRQTLECVPTGISGFDRLLGGGFDRGTSTMLLGPAGAGKSSLAAHYVVTAVQRGEKAAIYLFDESPKTWIARAEGLGLQVRSAVESGVIDVRQVDPADLAPGEFAWIVRQAVEQNGVGTIVIDSLNGYRNAMPEERFLTLHLHELLTYLNQNAVVTMLLMAQHGFIGVDLETSVDLSYLADTVILLRYFEAFGQVRQAISVVKKRSGQHARTIRELSLGPDGIRVGQALREFQGVLTGDLRYTGGGEPLLTRDEDRPED